MSCYATDGVGGGGMITIPCTCTHVGCYATDVVCGGDDNIPCTCTHVGCYATDGVGGGGMITFLALAHMLDATQLMGWVGGVFLLVYRLVESIYLLCLAVSRLKGV